MKEDKSPLVNELVKKEAEGHNTWPFVFEIWKHPLISVTNRDNNFEFKSFTVNFNLPAVINKNRPKVAW